MAQERGSPNITTIKRLFAHSGLRCAFTGCTMDIFQGSSIVGDICHIKAASPEGPRFDPTQSNEDRHAFENLILLCATHHRLIDGDPSKYTVEVISAMKAAHEGQATKLGDDEVDAAVDRFKGHVVTSFNQSGGVTAATVHIHAAPAAAPTVAKESVFDQLNSKHREVTWRLSTTGSAVRLMDGGILVMHVMPFSAVDGKASLAFPKIAIAWEEFPPIGAHSHLQHKILPSGVLIGSNTSGLSEPQRAYVQISRAGILESVASSIGVGHESKFLSLPKVERWIVEYTLGYARVLAKSGITAPIAVFIGFVDCAGKKLLQWENPTALHVDIPGEEITASPLDFEGATLGTIPTNFHNCARQLKPLLDHLATAAGLAASNIFDVDGNIRH